jgi:hypothetical protein
MFISQLVLYFVDYLLVLLNTMCILLARVGAAARCVRGRKRAGRRGREEKGGKKRAGGKGREEKGGKKRAGGKGREEKGGKTRQRAGGKGQEEKGCRQDKDAWVDALLDEIKHVAHDAPVGGTRQSRSGVVPIKEASIRHGKRLNKPT